MSKGNSDSITNVSKGLRNVEYGDESDIDGEFEYENDKEKIVEQSPRGRFIRFNEELGTGAYKTVYKAYDNDSGCEVAWNIIKLQPLPPKERKRISDEISLLKSLKHPNIINFISAWVNRQKEEVVFITEIVTGGTLKSYLKKIKSPRLKIIKGWCREILQGLEYLHNMEPNPIIHRDIKCENIFINSNKGEIRIGDLGLATCMSTSYAHSVLGTPHFMAPEMYEEVYGTGVDIYSFGMCLLEMVTQQIPYKECENPAQVYKKVLNGKKPQSLDLILNEEVKNFILECLKHKDERPSAIELLQSKFLTQSDENDNFPVKLLDLTPTNPIEEENSSELSKNSDLKPQRDGFLPFICEKNEKSSLYQNSIKLTEEIEQTKHADSEIKQNLVNERENRPSGCLHRKSFDKIIKEDTPYKKADQIANRREEDVNFNYELTLKSINEPYIYILIKKENHELEYLKEKFIQIDRRKFTIESLVSAVMQELEIQVMSTKLSQAISNFVDNIDFGLTNVSPKPQNNSNLTTNTSYSTANPSSTYVNNQYNGLVLQQCGLTKTNETVHSQFYEKGVSAPQNVNSSYFFQSDCFMSYYQHYLSTLPKDYSMNESEDSMLLRHKAELLELQNAHLMQRRALLDRKHAICVQSTMSLQSFPYDFNPNENEESQKLQHHLGGDETPFSAFSSGSMSPNDAVLNAENGFSSNNNSVDFISIIGKLNHHHNHQQSGASEDIGKPILQRNSLEKVQPSSNTSNLANRIISPKATNEINPQLFNSQLKKQSQQENCQNKILQIASDQTQARKDNQKGINNHQNLNPNIFTSRPAHSSNQTIGAEKLPAEDYNDQRAQVRKSSGKLLLQKQSSLDSPHRSQYNDNELTFSRGTVSERRKDALFGLFTQEDIKNLLKPTSPGCHPDDTDDLTKRLMINSVSQPHHENQETAQTLTQIHGSDTRVTPCPTQSINLQPELKWSPPKFSNKVLENCPKYSNSDLPRKKNFLKSTSVSLLDDCSGNSLLKCRLSPKNELVSEKNFAWPCISDLSKELLHNKEPKLNPALIEKIRGHNIKRELRREAMNLDSEDVLIVQTCLQAITGMALEANGLFGHYTEKALKCYQEKNGMVADGIITEVVWEKMKDEFEKKFTTKLQEKEREIKEIASKALEGKKFVKEKQIKEAQESLNKIQSELIDLSTL